MEGDWIKVECCRACGSSRIKEVISLGNQYVTNFVEETTNEKKIPLNLVICEHCKLLQMEHSINPNLVWNDQYWYKSGISTTIKDDLKDIVEKAKKIVPLEEGDLVIDIGCNDGTLLGFYGSVVNKVGFEPSGNVAKEAQEKGHYVINSFFNSENFVKEFGNKKAKIITAISMFYDLENPNEFLKDIKKCLREDGLFIIQQNYLLSMLEQNAFDNICHEHREYYSLISLERLLEKHGLEIFDVETNSINGGSIRTYIKLKEGSLNTDKNHGALNALKEKEKQVGLDTLRPYIEFNERVKNIKQKLISFLKEKKNQGKRIWIYGASTRGNVALQYFGIDSDLIEYIADKNSDKWGKKPIGSKIQITSPEEIIKRKPDYLLVNTWHFIEEIVKQEKEHFESGGIFVVALPEFKIIEKN